jgi:dUTP pyrophosphatase
MKIYVKKVDGVVLPERGSPVAAGYDIVATSEPKIVGVSTPPSKSLVYSRIDYIEYETNLFIAPEAVTFHTLIHPRSSISKYNLVLANSIGLVDNDYRGMVICRFKYVWQPEDMWMDATGHSLVGKVNSDKIYKKGDKIAQLVIEPTVQAEWVVVDDLTQTQRGSGGFGSTDKTGKPLTEVFAAEQKKFEERKTQAGPPDAILDAYLKAGGVATQLPYSERMKQARRE